MPVESLSSSPQNARECIAIKIAYAKPDEQWILSLEVPDSFTLNDAIQYSGILEKIPEIKLEAVGIFGKVCKLDQTLRAGDRIEIYRPLLIDPKELRRIRAKKNA